MTANATMAQVWLCGLTVIEVEWEEEPVVEESNSNF